MTVYPVEFRRRCEQKWESRTASELYESARQMPWLLAIGQILRAEMDGLEQPVSERLAAALKELDWPTAGQRLHVATHWSALAEQMERLERRSYSPSSRSEDAAKGH
jgi:hypothetical protein